MTFFNWVKFFNYVNSYKLKHVLNTSTKLKVKLIHFRKLQLTFFHIYNVIKQNYQYAKISISHGNKQCNQSALYFSSVYRERVCGNHSRTDFFGGKVGGERQHTRCTLYYTF